MLQVNVHEDICFFFLSDGLYHFSENSRNLEKQLNYRSDITMHYLNTDSNEFKSYESSKFY